MNLQVHLQIFCPRLLLLSLGLQVIGPHPIPPSLLASQALFLTSAYNLTSIFPLPFSVLACLHGDPPSSSNEDDPMLAEPHSSASNLSLPSLALFTALEQHQ
ncbi:hypothetical protein AAC387_Pa02g3893 [Persea americana]